MTPYVANSLWIGSGAREHLVFRRATREVESTQRALREIEAHRHAAALAAGESERARIRDSADAMVSDLVRDIVTAAIALVHPQAFARGVTLIAECRATMRVGDDAAVVRQILVNLLANAVKFTPPGGRVTVACDMVWRPATSPRDAAAGVRVPWFSVSVEDTGIGIAAEDLPRLFEPFVRLTSATTMGEAPPTEGTGLGLSISRRLARRLGGDITVESRPGIGSTFTLWLPSGSPGELPQPGDESSRAEQ